MWKETDDCFTVRRVVAGSVLTVRGADELRREIRLETAQRFAAMYREKMEGRRRWLKKSYAADATVERQEECEHMARFCFDVAWLYAAIAEALVFTGNVEDANEPRDFLYPTS